MKPTKRIATIIHVSALVLSQMANAKTADVPGVGKQPITYFYTGKPYDNDLGTYAFLYRNYDPHITRWLSSDPSGFPDGSNNQIYAPVPTDQLDFQGLMTKTWNIVSAGASDPDPASIKLEIFIVKSATVQVLPDSDGECACWTAVIDQPFSFKLVGIEYLPTINTVWTHGGHSGPFDSAFIAGAGTHEGWNRTISDDEAEVTYAALEDWSSGYSSNKFQTYDDALAAGNYDLSHALTTASAYFDTFDDENQDHAGTGANYGWSSSAGKWVVNNPNWGGAFDTEVNQFQINFSKKAGECE